MPQLTAQGKTFTCSPSADLRQVLLANSIPVHNDQAALINCRGLGTCGTCAVEISELRHWITFFLNKPENN